MIMIIPVILIDQSVVINDFIDVAALLAMRPLRSANDLNINCYMIILDMILNTYIIVSIVNIRTVSIGVV